MIVLDHNIPFDQSQQLRSWRIQTQHVGFNVGRPEWADQQEVLRHLHSLRQPTFFTRDLGFFKRRLCHRNYCLVVLTGPAVETARDIRRFLRHHELRRKTSRLGCIVKCAPQALYVWRLNTPQQQKIPWNHVGARKR